MNQYIAASNQRKRSINQSIEMLIDDDTCHV